MLRLAVLAIAVCAIACPAGAAQAETRADATAGIDVSAQQRDPAARPRSQPRPRIRVTPRYPYRTWHSPYPLPYDIEFPGPNAYRQCTFRLVQEVRPSGTVIVPRQRCWWVRG